VWVGRWGSSSVGRKDVTRVYWTVFQLVGRKDKHTVDQKEKELVENSADWTDKRMGSHVVVSTAVRMDLELVVWTG
jgi:hypothetical protein